MKITNKQNLPANLVAAVTYSERNREGCDYTITELLSPPRVLALKRQHEHEVTEDVSERLWSLLGQAGHAVLQRYGRQAGKAIVEERAIVEVACGSKKFKIGGQLDYVATAENALDDFKFTSVWAIKEGCKPEWVQQLNLYRWLLWHYGVHIDTMRIIAIARDWSVREARRDPTYPQSQAEVFTIAPWSWGYCESFCCERIGMHEVAKVALPDCTAEDTWEKSSKWAVMKGANKRATKLYDASQGDDARAHARDIPGGRVEFRPGERPRCESYCSCSQFCNQYAVWRTGQAT